MTAAPTPRVELVGYMAKSSGFQLKESLFYKIAVVGPGGRKVTAHLIPAISMAESEAWSWARVLRCPIHHVVEEKSTTIETVSRIVRVEEEP